MDAINWLTPFKSKPEHHEDRLTWALLVTLRYVPELQRYLRGLLEDFGDLDGGSASYWEAAEVRTQTKSLGDGFTRLISVLLTDVPIPEPIPVTLSDRNAVYDGVVEFSDGLLVVVENKLKAEAVWKEQLNPAKSSIPETHAEYEICNEAVVLEWGKVLEGFLRFESSGMGSYAANEIVSDFLRFVENTHPTLTPYRTFELCGDREAALRRRISRLVEDLAQSSPELTSHKKPGLDGPHVEIPDGVVRRWRLALAKGTNDQLLIREHIWPGDTVAQARKFFDNVNMTRLSALSERGWILRPNLHFSFMSSHLVWADTSLPVLEYLDMFDSGEAVFGQESADGSMLMPKLEQWVQRGLVRPSDVADVSRHFIETKRQTVNIIPGLALHRDWPLAEIVAMEQAGRLESTLVASVNEALSVWGQSI